MASVVEEPTCDGDDAKAAAELASIALPVNTVKRITRSAAPGVRFSGEALAALHRICQAYILWATDRSVVQASADDARQTKKVKGKAVAHSLTSRRLTATHVMRFLEAELPQIAAKVGTLFPDLVPSESKPTAVRLLEQLREQEKKLAAGEEAIASVGQVAPAPDAPQTATKREASSSAAGAPPGKKQKGGKVATPSVASFFTKKPVAFEPPAPSVAPETSRNVVVATPETVPALLPAAQPES